MGDTRKANKAIAAKRVGVRYDKKTLARYTGYSVSWFEKKIAEGAPVAVPGRSGVPLKIDLGQFIGWLIENEKAKAEAKCADQIRRLRIALKKAQENQVVFGGTVQAQYRENHIVKNGAAQQDETNSGDGIKDSTQGESIMTDETGETKQQEKTGGNGHGSTEKNSNKINAGNSGKRSTQNKSGAGLRAGDDGVECNTRSTGDSDTRTHDGKMSESRQSTGLAGGSANTPDMNDLFDGQDELMLEGEEEAKRRLSVAKASMAEIDLAIRQGKVVDVDLVCRVLDKVIASCRARLLAIPRKAAPLVVAAESVNEANVIIETNVHEALDELSRLDPADFIAS